MSKDKTGVSIGIRGRCIGDSVIVAAEDDIIPSEVSESLGLQATIGWNRGDKCIITHTGREISRPYGVWNYSTRDILDSDDVNEHIMLIFRTFESRMASLKHYVSDERYYVQFQIWFEGPYGLAAFGLNHEELTRIMSMCNEVRIVVARQNDPDEIWENDIYNQNNSETSGNDTK
jgi:hypothetical protein